MLSKTYTHGNMVAANIVVALLVIVICASFMPKLGQKAVRLEACRFGFAHYVADSSSGEPRFVWNKELLPVE